MMGNFLQSETADRQEELTPVTDTPPSAEQIIDRQQRLSLRPTGERIIQALSDAGYIIFPTETANSLADFVLEFAKDKRLQKTAYEVSGKIIVDKDELQDICNAIAVGDQASAWEKLTSMTKDTGSGEEQEEGFFGGKSIPPPWDTGS